MFEAKEEPAQGDTKFLGSRLLWAHLRGVALEYLPLLAQLSARLNPRGCRRISHIKKKVKGKAAKVDIRVPHLSKKSKQKLQKIWGEPLVWHMGRWCPQGHRYLGPRGFGQTHCRHKTHREFIANPKLQKLWAHLASLLKKYDPHLYRHLCKVPKKYRTFGKLWATLALNKGFTCERHTDADDAQDALGPVLIFSEPGGDWGGGGTGGGGSP